MNFLAQSRGELAAAERIHENSLLKSDPTQVDMKLQVISSMAALLAILQ